MDSEALAKTIFGVILVLASSFVGAVCGAILGAIKGPYFILAQMDGNDDSDIETRETNSTSTDRI